MFTAYLEAAKDSSSHEDALIGLPVSRIKKTIMLATNSHKKIRYWIHILQKFDIFVFGHICYLWTLGRFSFTRSASSGERRCTIILKTEFRLPNLNRRVQWSNAV